MNGIVLVGIICTKDILREIKIAESRGLLKFSSFDILTLADKFPRAVLAIYGSHSCSCRSNIHCERTICFQVKHLRHLISIILPINKDDGPVSTRKLVRVFRSDSKFHRTSVRSLNQLKMQVEVAGGRLCVHSLREEENCQET